LRPAPSAPTIPLITIQMTDRDVMERFARLVGVSVRPDQRHIRNPAWKPVFCARITGGRAIRFMTALRPIMGTRRQAQIDAALAAREEAMVGRTVRKVLTDDQRREIARRLDAGERAAALATDYSITREHVYRAARRGQAGT
jgi:hypothetical protein